MTEWNTPPNFIVESLSYVLNSFVVSDTANENTRPRCCWGLSTAEQWNKKRTHILVSKLLIVATLCLYMRDAKKSIQKNELK